MSGHGVQRGPDLAFLPPEKKFLHDEEHIHRFRDRDPRADPDEQTEAGMIELFKTMNRQRGTTFIIVAHSPELVGQAARRLKMSNGSLQEM